MVIFAFKYTNLLAHNSFNSSIATFGYIFGAFLVIYLLNFKNRLIIFAILVIIPLIVLITVETSELNNSLPLISLIFINLGAGMLEVLNIYLIVSNSNRPEFFIGMLTFIGYLCQTVATFYT